MPEIAGPGSKRKRTATACQTCREMKSKCDGIRPACGKCEGYGYRCIYPESRRGKTRHPAETGQSGQSPATDAPLDNLGRAFAEYKALAQELVDDVPDEKGEVAARRLAAVTNEVEAGLLNLRSTVQLSGPAPRHPLSTGQTTAQSERYLGEVSDVQFFNLVKRSLRDNTLAGRGVDEAMESYELDDHPETTLDHSVERPSLEISKEYLEIYFSTIHLAYPFLQRPIFMKTHDQLRESSAADKPSDLWLAHLYVIFAIGSYYTSFPRKDGAATHAGYFQRALVLGTREILERSVTQVSFLLIQCFYLLAVCRTDRCWTTLGLAIRVAQSIGLHVEESGSSGSMRDHTWPKAESRRRLWYSLYVLDRLLSLQLGRPPAIHDDDFNVALPSRLEDTAIDWENEGPLPPSPQCSSGGDYFVEIISLSHIISCVLCDLYSPRRSLDLAAILECTKQLDKQLLAWKHSLPRTLRFDFGHAFETSHIFRRQRNMLAIKFYHLRALIHRPSFCLSLLHPHDIWDSLSATERLTLSRYERICVSSAQETAHLLHNVSSEQELVHDFPWWQMISCLICAGSILLVSSLFTSPLEKEEEHLDVDFSVATLNADAETCLKIFEALSVNSDAARLAKDMMTKLKERGREWKQACTAQTSMELSGQAPVQQPTSDLGTALQPHYEDDISIFTHLDMVPGAAHGIIPEEWPAEILDSMAWSAHFLEAVNSDRQMETHLV